MTLALATNLMFLGSILILGGLSIWQALQGRIADVVVTNAIAAGIIAIW